MCVINQWMDLDPLNRHLDSILHVCCQVRDLSPFWADKNSPKAKFDGDLQQNWLFCVTSYKKSIRHLRSNFSPEINEFLSFCPFPRFLWNLFDNLRYHLNGWCLSVSASCGDLVIVVATIRSIQKIGCEIFLKTTWEPGHIQN